MDPNLYSPGLNIKFLKYVSISYDDWNIMNLDAALCTIAIKLGALIWFSTIYKTFYEGFSPGFFKYWLEKLIWCIEIVSARIKSLF